jgi:uncharacterized metal-binding protein YceD (DUF177 family)
MGLEMTVAASPAECAAIASRLDIPSIVRMTCQFRLVRDGDGISVTAQGALRAVVTRTCVVSAEDFEMSVDEDFEVRFVPAGHERDDLDPETIDEIPYIGEKIDLGEATIEQLSLALDPYPRMPDAVVPDVEDEGTRSPFAVLRRTGKAH